MNIGKNKGRTLQAALSRFAAILIDEARDITGMTFPQLDEALGLPDGQSYRYSLFPIRNKSRAPQAAAIQQLENRVAKLLERSAHQIVIYDNLKLDDVASCHLIDDIVGKPEAGINLRNCDGAYLQLGYEGEWPTYRRLKCNPQNLRLYTWQWGILWNNSMREALNIPLDAPVETFLPTMTEKTKRERSLINLLEKTAAGREIADLWGQALKTITDDVILDDIYARVLLVAEATEKLIKCGSAGILPE